MASDRIPIVETYRDVGIHVFQDAERIALVKKEIDDVYTIDDLKKLVEFAGDQFKSPEARLFAAAKCEAAWEIAAENRELRPAIDLDYLHACVAGLDSLHWISSQHYGSALQPGPPPGVDYPQLPVPLTAEQCGRRR